MGCSLCTMRRKESPTEFGRAVHRLGLSDSQVAEALGVTRQYVNQLARRKVTPGLALAKRIMKWSAGLGEPVPMESW